MAALMESIAFTKILNEGDIIDIADADTEGNILLSSKRKSFVIYKLSDRKPQKSWSVRHGVTLTSPVRWDHHSERFVTVTNYHDVKLWDKDLADFSRAKTKHSPTQIHEVFTLPDFHDVILLYSNGCVGFLDGIKDNHKTGPLKLGDSILWCRAVISSLNLCVIFVAKSEDKVCLFVNWFKSEESKWSQNPTVLSLKDKSVDICSIDSIQNKDQTDVYVLWNNGVLTRVSVEPESIEKTDLSEVLSRIHGNCGMVVIDPTHIAIAGCKNDDEEDGIGIYDIKFGILQTWQAFTEKSKGKCKIFFVQGHLFYPRGQTLYACKYECHTSTVGSILGRSRSKCTTIPQHHLWSGQEKKKGTSEPKKDLAEMFSNLLNKSLSYETFQRQFVTLLNNLEDKRNKHWLTSSHMVSLVERIVEETKFWPKQEIQILMEKQFVPVNSIVTVLDKLIQESDINLLHCLISSSNNLSERCLCKVLGFYLQCNTDEIKSAVEEIEVFEDEDQTEDMDIDDEGVEDDVDKELHKPSKCPVSQHQAFLLDCLLLKPYSDVFLLECLRSIEFKSAQKLLEYLSYLLEKKSLLSDNLTSPTRNQLTVPQIVDWLCLVIDAHMTQFVLSPYSHLTLIKLHSVVSSHVDFMSNLVNLEALLLQLKEKSVLMQDRKVGQYCIEVLHIS